MSHVHDHRTSLICSVEQYLISAPNSEEICGKFLDLITTVPHCADRETLPAHLTASAWVVNPTLDACLLIFHKKLGIWIQAGGHADGDFNLGEVAKREVREETGIVASKVLDTSIFDLDIHDIPETKSSPPHQHFDVRYLFKAEDGGRLTHNEEVHAALWVPFDEVENYTQEHSILRMRKKCKAILF